MSTNCGRCSCPRDNHGGTKHHGKCSCGKCSKFARGVPSRESWYVIVREGGALRAIGPLARWLDARKLAEITEDKSRDVHTSVTSERPKNMRVRGLVDESNAMIRGLRS
jgi:hypothetical protein